MLVQASNYYISAGGKIAEYITAGKKVTYSIHGNNPKIKPKKKFFPNTKSNISILFGLDVKANSIKCLPAKYGYHTYGLNLAVPEDITFYDIDVTNKPKPSSLIFIDPYGYGYHTCGLELPTNDNININHSFTNDEFNTINF
jgi:hypothetical protein